MSWTINGNVATWDSDTNLKVTGVKNDENALAYDEATKTVTVSKAALSNDSNVIVTINDGYTLALGNDVSGPVSTPESWSPVSGGTITYKSASTTAGYTLADDKKSISYTKKDGGGEVEISGIKSKDGITISDKTITIATSALNKQKVTIDDEGYYTLALGEDVVAPTTTKEGWTLEGTKATYKTKQVTEGYTLSNNEIEYTAASGGDTVVEVSDVKDIKGLETHTSDSVVAVYASALDPASVVSASEGYTLELGSDVTESTVTTGWVPSGDNMAYRINETTAGYKITDNKIGYIEAAGGSTLAEFNGLTDTSTPTVLNDYQNIEFAAGNFKNDVSLVSSEVVDFELTAGEYANKTFTAGEAAENIKNAGTNVAIYSKEGSDTINNSGTDVTVNGGTGDDNVTMNAASNASVEGSNNIFAYSGGDGKDILYNFGVSDKIQILDASTFAESVKNKDVIFKIDNGSITLRDAAERELTITLVGAEETDIISSYRYTKNGITRGDVIELAATLKKPYTQEDNISVVNGANVRDGAQIIGNDNSEGGTFIGGVGKDTLISGQNDFSLQGGEGNDLFVYGGGNDTIGDYSQKGTYGADRISLGSFEEANYEVNGNDVIISYGEEDSLTLVEGKDKEITFAGKKSNVKIYSDAGVLDGKKKSIKLAKDTDGTFSASGTFKKLATIDASAVDAELEITGNTKANLIVAGRSNTTLNGGKGKDTLVGGDGRDVFVYADNSGNKLIQNYDYAQSDIVSLGGEAEISQVTSKKGNAILKVGNNTITIEGVGTSQFTFVQGEETKIYNNGIVASADGKSATLSSDAKGEYNLTSTDYAQYTNVSAELGKKSVTLIGDADDNVLTGGAGKDSLNGGANNDTLNGGKGNDVLWGGDDADTFIYQAGTGTDTIMDYSFADGDLLQIIDKRGREITDAVKKWSFEGDDLTLSIKGGGKLILAGVGTSATVKYNGTEHSF